MPTDTDRLNWLESQYANLRFGYVIGSREEHRRTWAAPRIRELIDKELSIPEGVNDHHAIWFPIQKMIKSK